MNVHVIYVLEHKTSKKTSVCLSGCTYVRTWTLAVDTITFERLNGCKKKLVRAIYVWNVGSVLLKNLIQHIIMTKVLSIFRILQIYLFKRINDQTLKGFFFGKS